MLIDLHAHVIPGEFPAPASGAADGAASGHAGAHPGWPRLEPADVPGARLLVAGKLRFTAQAVFFDAERRLAAMDVSGVDAEVVSPMPPLLNYALPPDSGRDLCRWVNEFIAGLCQAAPGRFFGLGMVPLQDPHAAAAELAGIREMGLAGVEIGSNIGGTYLGDSRFLDFFGEAERLRMPIFVHALSPVMADRLPGSATGTFGFAAEIGLAAASIITGGVAEKCPDLRLAFSHGAGGFPLMLTRAQYFWGRTWNEELPASGPPGASTPGPSTPETGPLGTSPAALARRFYYDTLVFDRRAVRYLIDMIGPARLLVGTDFPAMPREEPAGRTLRSMGLDGPVLEDIMWNNCFRFLGIAAPTARSAPRHVDA